MVQHWAVGPGRDLARLQALPRRPSGTPSALSSRSKPCVASRASGLADHRVQRHPWESNGLLDFARNQPSTIVSRRSTPDVRPAALQDTRSRRSGYVSHYGPGNWSGVAVRLIRRHTLAALPVPARAGRSGRSRCCGVAAARCATATEAVLDLCRGDGGPGAGRSLGAGPAVGVAAGRLWRRWVVLMQPAAGRSRTFPPPLRSLSNWVMPPQPRSQRFTGLLVTDHPTPRCWMGAVPGRYALSAIARPRPVQARPAGVPATDHALAGCALASTAACRSAAAQLIPDGCRPA